MEKVAGGCCRLKRPIDVILCGYYGFGNLGDELIAESLIRLLEKNGVPAERIVLLSAEPRGWSGKSVGLVDRWKPVPVMSALRSSRTLLLGGGGLFQDTTSLRSPLYYWGVTRMARLAGCRTWAFGQSIGPLQNRIAASLARNALSACEARVVRDRGSMDMLEKWELEGEMAPDTAFVLADELSESAEGKDHLLVNIRPWQGGLPEAAAEAAEWLRKERRLEMTGVALSEEDVLVMEDLRKRGVFRPSEIVRLSSLAQARSLWGKARGAFGMRLHFCLISVLARIPCHAVPYDPKVSFFAQEWGLPVWDGSSKPLLPDHAGDGSKVNDQRLKVEESFARTLKKVLSGV